jgi:Flp pilus assembly protein TadD
MLNTVEFLQLALEHQQSGRWAEAERIYSEVLARRPDHPDALHLLGVLAAQTGRPERAAALIARAIALNPAAPFYHNNLGNVLQELGRFAESVLCYREALRLEPAYVEALVNLGNALNKLDRFEEALGCYLEAQRLRPAYAGVYVNLAHALIDEGLLEEASGCVEEALRLEPGNAQAHCARALIRLLEGDFERGLPEYEWRWQLENAPRRCLEKPRWDGSRLEGRTILLEAEQGLGDTIQFLRFAEPVKQAGGRVVLECPPPLLELARTAPGVDEVVPAGDPLPPFDVHAPLLSLPLILGLTRGPIPNRTPYLCAPAPPPEAPPLPGEGTLRVGLAWAGNPRHKNDRRRSPGLEQFAPLAGLPGVTFVSLQKGPRAEQALQPPPGLNLALLPGCWADLPWLAAAIERLDLVITPDTLHAHLAGALGKPVWVLLSFAPDWRWMRGRCDSPWYPTMRLFRQPKRGDWASALEQVRQELGRLAARGRAGDALGA